MTTPQISGQYRFQLDLKGRSLPVTFTVPDIPDTPPSEEHFDPNPSLIVTDKETSFEDTSDIPTQRAHTDPLDAIHIEEDQPNLLPVSAYLFFERTTGQRMMTQGLGVSIHNKTIRGKGIQYRWFCLQGKHMPLENPSDIQGTAELRPLLHPQIFDVFIHVFYPAAGHSSGSKDRTVKLWVWVPRESSDSSEAFWKPVTVGYVCPGPGLLEGRHLMITDQGEPTWVTGSTRYRRYKVVKPPTAPHE